MITVTELYPQIQVMVTSRPQGHSVEKMGSFNISKTAYQDESLCAYSLHQESFRYAYFVCQFWIQGEICLFCLSILDSGEIISVL